MEKNLTRRLMSIGKECFVRDFAWFQEAQRTGDNTRIVDRLMKMYGYTEKGAKTRVSGAKGLLRDKVALRTCLEHIFREAEKVPLPIREKARKLWEDQQEG